MSALPSAKKPTKSHQRCAAFQGRQQLVRSAGAVFRIGRSLLDANHGASAQSYFNKAARLMGLLPMLTGVLEGEVEYSANAWEEWRQLLSTAFKDYEPVREHTINEFKDANHLLARLMLVHWGDQGSMLISRLPTLTTGGAA